MDILDGRRAVPGDLVECIKDGPWMSADDGNVEPGPKSGERLTVERTLLTGGDKTLIFDEYKGKDKNEIVCYIAHEFRIVPEDQKAKQNIAFYTKEKV